MITNEQRMERLATLPENTREIYGSIETARFLTKLNDKYNLPRGGPMIDVVGDVILGLQPKEKLPELLVSEAKIQAETAKKIAEELEGFLSTDELPKTPTKPTYTPGGTLPTAESKLKEKLELRPDVPNQREEKEKAFRGPESRPLTRDELMKSLSATRTMARDIEAVKGSDPTPTTPPSTVPGTPTTEEKPQ